MEAGRTAQVDALDATGSVAGPQRSVTDPSQRPDTSLANAPTLVGEMTPRPPLEVAELPIGAEIGRRYKITGRIGAGGMGVVYRAHDPQLDREVALKLLLVSSEVGGSEGRGRMLREAQAAAKIRHPNVVTVYDAGEVDGRVFIAMELIDGVTLKAWLRQKKRPWQDVLAVLLLAGEGLAAAHAVGLVHRDFKPDNVLVEADGRAHVLDFGLARPVLDTASGVTRESGSRVLSGTRGEVLMQTLTQTGMAVGTPAYMAPEQHLARPSSARSDQFAFCVATYEALYGQRPFHGDNYAELSLAVVEGRVVPPPRRTAVPAAVWQALRRGLSPDPNARYPTLEDLLAELRESLRPGVRGIRVALVAAALAVPGLALAGSSMFAGEPPPPLPPAEEHALPIDDADDRGGPSPRAAVPLVPPEEPTTPVLKPTLDVDVAALRDLLAPIVPEPGARLVVTADGGLALAGAERATWKLPVGQLAAAIAVPRRPIGELTSATAPNGFWAAYELGAKDYEKRADAVEELPGVESVLRSPPLGVVVVRAPLEAQVGVGRWLKRKAEFKEWCFNNVRDRGGRLQCRPTRSECEAERKSWLDGVEAQENLCYGRS